MGFSDILDAMAYSAFKGTGQKPAAQEIPVGCASPKPGRTRRNWKMGPKWCSRT